MTAKDDIKEFYDNSPHRGLGIALPTILENRLTEALKIVMRRDATIEKDLFRGPGALGSFAVKIQLAYMLGLIAKDTYRDLDILRKVRNDFAHNVKVKTFDDQRISNRIKSMHVYKVLVGLRDTHPFDPRRVEPFLKKVQAQILRDEMGSTRDAFRMCVRMLIHHLNKLEQDLRKAPTPWVRREPKGGR